MVFVKCGVSWRREGNKGHPERILGDISEGPRYGEGGEEVGADVQGVCYWDHHRLWATADCRGVLGGNIPVVHQKVCFILIC